MNQSYYSCQAVRDAIASGIDGYDDDMRNSVRKASQGLRLTTEAAMAIASKAVCAFTINDIKFCSEDFFNLNDSDAFELETCRLQFTYFKSLTIVGSESLHHLHTTIKKCWQSY